MGRCLALIIALFVVAGVSRADTTWVAAGAVSGNWTAANSPYMIQGTITVPTNSGLLIGPGVRVFFTGPYFLRIDSAAQFNALGTPGDSVVFTTDTLANPSRWLGIKARHSGPDTLHVDYCVIEHVYDDSIDPYAGDMFLGCRVHMTHSALRHSYGEVAAFLFGGTDFRIDSCAFVNNRAAMYGALWLVGGHQAQVTGCLFVNNTGTYSGALALAGMWTFDVTNCTFIGNRGAAGGACELECEGIFQGCTFADNIGLGGGAVYIDHVEGINFADCTFRNNQATGAEGGGAILAGQTNGTFRNCVFEGNRAPSGGAIYCANWEWAEDFEFTRCRFTGNSATEAGGVLYGGARSVWSYCVLDSNCAPQGGAINVWSWDFRMDHCTVVANSAADTGSVLSILTGQGYWNFELRNSLFANSSGASCLAWSERNDTSYGYPVLHPDSIHHNLFFANAGGNTSATAPGFGAPTMLNANGDSCDAFHNLYLDPRFVNLSAGDYHLLATSPCIDAGDPASPPDSDGTVADIGAYSSPYLPDAVRPEPATVMPGEFALHAAFPNPFNAVTLLAYDLPQTGDVTLVVYNLLGGRVATLVDSPVTAGRHQVRWNAVAAGSGTYFAVLQAGSGRRVQKLLLLK